MVSLQLLLTGKLRIWTILKWKKFSTWFRVWGDGLCEEEAGQGCGICDQGHTIKCSKEFSL